MADLRSILLFGLPGSGKSTAVSFIQSRRPGCYFALDADDIAGAAMNAGLKGTDAYKCAAPALEYQIDRNAKYGSAVLLSGAMATSERFNQLYQSLIRYGQTVPKILLIDASIETCLGRIRLRSSYQPHRPTPDDLEEILSVYKKLEVEHTTVTNESDMNDFWTGINAVV